MTPNDIVEEFSSARALLEGHFILSSGLHSPLLLQKILVFQDRCARSGSAGFGRTSQGDFLIS